MDNKDTLAPLKFDNENSLREQDGFGSQKREKVQLIRQPIQRRRAGTVAASP
jgi:hypothetical protein